MKLDSHLFFNGQAKEALALYESALGASVESKVRYADCPEPIPAEYLPPGGAQKLLHASALVQGERLMVSDGMPEEASSFHGFALTLRYDNEVDARKAFDGLADNGGNVIMPLSPTFFSPCYGQLFDRFGVRWMIMVDATQAN